MLCIDAKVQIITTIVFIRDIQRTQDAGQIYVDENPIMS